MALLILDHPVELPVGELAKNLGLAIPEYQWRVGDGEQTGTARLDRPTSIMGRHPSGEMVLMGIELVPQPLPLSAGAPPHQVHILFRGPSVDDPDMATRILLVTGATVALAAGRGTMQFEEGGRWYRENILDVGLERAMADRGGGHFRATAFLAEHGEVGGAAAAAGVTAPTPAPPPRSAADAMMIDSDLRHTFAKILTDLGGADLANSMGYQTPPSYAEEEPRENRLPTFVIALDRPIEFDWEPLKNIGEFDPAGGWRVEPGENGTGKVHGRGGTIEITHDPAPIPDYILTNAKARSFWFRDDGSLARRTSSLVITNSIDTRTAPFEDVRETAKVMTLLLGLLTRTPGVITLLNNGIHTLLTPQMVQEQVGHLHKNQIPVMLWTWTAPDSMARDNVSLSTGGLLPFLGYELEVWNGPGDPQWVGDKMSEIINYLLHVGPTVKDGDSFGESKEDQSIRGFFGTTRAQRHDKNVKALLLEFDNPSGIEVPKADPLPGNEPPAAPATEGPALNDLSCIIARAWLSPYPGNIVIEQLERNFPDYRWTTEEDVDQRCHRITGMSDGQTVKAMVYAHALSIAKKLNPPPHRFCLDVSVGTSGDQALARRIGLVIACCNVIQIDRDAHFQLGEGGNWLSHDDALTGVSLPRHTSDIGDFDLHFGEPPSRFAGINPYLPDAFPPMPDVFADAYLSMRVNRTPNDAGAGLKGRMDAALNEPPPPPTPPRPGMFGRRGLFGRKGS